MKTNFRFLLAVALALAASSAYALEGFPPGNTNTATPSLTITEAIATSGSPVALTVTGAAHTTLAASTEDNDISLNLARTVQWSTGAITTQRALYIQAPTYGFVGASTVTDAATVDISGAPVAGTNATLTRAHAFRVEAGQTTLGGGVVVGANNVAATAGNGLTIAPAARTTGSPALFTVTAPADTTLAASTESNSVNINTSATRQFATGALTTQRENYVQAPTYAFVGASTITDAATLDVSGAPIAGTNATLTRAHALRIEAGQTSLGGAVVVGSASTAASTGAALQIVPAVRTTGSPNTLILTEAADTTLTASTESTSAKFDLSATRQFATGALTTQRAAAFLAPTYGFVGASTLTNAATLAVSGAPVAGTNATITNAYALWVQAGLSEFDGDVQVKSGQHVRTGAATNDVVGTITLAAGSGTRTFATAYTAAPVCVCTDQTANASVKCATTTTVLTATGTGTDVIAYSCFGNPN